MRSPFSRYMSGTEADSDYPASRNTASQEPTSATILNYGEAPCRTCTDFKSWVKFHRGNTEKPLREDCPLNKDELGHKTWAFLHTMVAHYPDEPTSEQQKDMSTFLKLLSQFYPCPACARDFSELMVRKPPRTTSQTELSKWLCWAHNKVNVKLGKPKFDCTLLDQRWKTGWKDGSCN